jgi:urea carboxylase-associated protein 1
MVELGAGEGWIGEVPAGGELVLTDLHGNQAVDALFFDAGDYTRRYDACATIVAQGNAYLTSGSVLRSGDGTPLLTITEDTCGRHDTLGGACAQESNDVRYGRHTRFMHSCRDTFLLVAAQWGRGLTKRDLAPNINFFMNVPVTEDGRLTFEDGISAPGKLVRLRAERPVLALLSNCPQLNNPCNGYDPTPVRVEVLAP